MIRRKVLGLILPAVILSGCQWQNQIDQKEHEQKEVTNRESNNPQNELMLDSRFFNQIEEVDGEKTIQNGENILALVNKEYVLPGSYKPQDLVRPKVNFSFGDEDIEKSYIRKEAAAALESMFDAAAKQGINLYAASGYRSYKRQTEVFRAETNKVGEEQAEQAVAVPGNSEHQTGLAMDITSENVQFRLTEEFGEKPEGQWLADHAYEYGYVLRYPKEKEKITGYQYEPWHFRYVGKEAAATMHQKGWTLEEYFAHVKKET